MNDVEMEFEKIAEFAGESEIYVSGHSAGAQLAAMMLNTRLARKITGLILLSGVYDLQPLVRTSINENLSMTLKDARRLSPMLATPLSCQVPDEQRCEMRVLIVYGEFDSPAFHKQSEDYREVYLFKNKILIYIRIKLFLLILKVLNDSKFTNIKVVKYRNVDHFNLVENISDDEFELTREVYKTMRA